MGAAHHDRYTLKSRKLVKHRGLYLWKVKQEDGRFKAILSHKMKPWLKTKKQNEIKTWEMWSSVVKLVWHAQAQLSFDTQHCRGRGQEWGGLMNSGPGATHRENILC